MPSSSRRTARRPSEAPSTQWSFGRRDGFSILAPPLDQPTNELFDGGVEPGHTLGHRQAEVHMLLSFQRPSPPGRRGFLLEDAPRAVTSARGR